MEVGGGLGGRGRMGKEWDNCNSINDKMKIIKQIHLK